MAEKVGFEPIGEIQKPLKYQRFRGFLRCMNKGYVLFIVQLFALLHIVKALKIAVYIGVNGGPRGV